jgi:hypothetical protein
MVRTFAIAVTLALVGSACGGGDDASSSTSADVEGTAQVAVDVGNAPTPDPSSVAIADALVEAHGEEGGFAALVLALDRGYDNAQIEEAAREARLDTDGVITDAAGGVEAPAGTAGGVFELPEASAAGVVLAASSGSLRRAYQQERLEPTRMRAQLAAAISSPYAELDTGRALIVIITELARSGYNLDQVVAELIAGDAVLEYAGRDCPALVVGVDFIEPANRVGQCSDYLISLVIDQEDDTTAAAATSTTAAEGGAADTAADEDPPPATDPPAASASSIAAIADGTYTGTLDNFEFRDKVTVVSSEATITKTGDAFDYDWSVQWEQELRDCSYQNRDSWGGSELITTTDTLLQIGGTRRFEVDLVSTCPAESGDIASTFSRPMTLNLVGSQLTGSIGIATVTFDVALSD